MPLGTEKRAPDLSCAVVVGDQPFVRQPSMILYRHCRLMLVSEIRKNLLSGRFTYESPASEALYAAIMQGLFVSPFSEPWARAYAAANSG